MGGARREGGESTSERVKNGTNKLFLVEKKITVLGQDRDCYGHPYTSLHGCYGCSHQDPSTGSFAGCSGR